MLVVHVNLNRKPGRGSENAHNNREGKLHFDYSGLIKCFLNMKDLLDQMFCELSLDLLQEIRIELWKIKSVYMLGFMDRDAESQCSQELNFVNSWQFRQLHPSIGGFVASSGSKWLVLPDIISPVAFCSAYSVCVLHLRILAQV